MRPDLSQPPVTSHAAEKMQRFHADIVDEVRTAVATHDVVVVGMTQNRHPARARKALDDAGIAFHYVGYGSYLSKWKERLALKLWSGWPTFPQVFVRGTLIGGADQLIHMIEDGSLRAMLAEDRDRATA